MEEWLIIQNFFHGLNQQAKDHVDAAAGGSFLSLDVAGAKTLINKIASNQYRRISLGHMASHLFHLLCHRTVGMI